MVLPADSNVIKSLKSKVNDHPGFNPYEYSVKELYLTPEEEDEVPYLVFRREMINKEKMYAESEAKRAESVYWDAQQH